MLRVVSQTMAELGMELDTATAAEGTVRSGQTHRSLTQGALPEILLRISGCREQHSLSSEPTLMGSSPTNLLIKRE